MVTRSSNWKRVLMTARRKSIFSCRRAAIIPWFLLVLLATLSAASAVLATGPTILYVKPGGAKDGACASWAKACDLEHALASASAPAELWVMKGVYKPHNCDACHNAPSGAERAGEQSFHTPAAHPGSTDKPGRPASRPYAASAHPGSTDKRTATFALVNGVALYGGFGGTETKRSQRDFKTNVTTLSGDIGKVGDKRDNAYHVVTASGTDDTAVLDGFTITAGNANAGDCPGSACGGGIYNEEGSPTIRNVILTANSATSGGGMYNYNGSNPVLTNVTLSANSATSGGGMYNYNGSNPVLTNVTLSANSARDHGGGMYNVLCSPALTRVTLTNNTARQNAGGMFNEVGGNPTLTNVILSGNTAGHDAGGIYNSYYSNPVLIDVTLSGNTAGHDAGGMYNTDHSSPTLTNVTFSGNSAASDGGAMYNGHSDPVLTNVTLSGNKANEGGALHNWASSPTLTNVTLSGNSGKLGGAIYNDYSANPIIQNSILWGNSAPTGPQIYNLPDAGSPSIPIIAYSILRGGCPTGSNCLAHILKTNPFLQPLASNGGRTQTMALGSKSSAINAADPTLCPDQDQRVKPRRKANGYCDIGAYEAQPADLIARTGTPQSAPINHPFAVPLAVVMRDSFQNPLGGVLITYTPPASGASATLTGNPAISNALGIASVAATANGVHGAYAVTARTGALPVVKFNLTNK